MKPHEAAEADSARAIDPALGAEIVNTLLTADYETVTLIDGETGKARALIGGHLQEVIAEQESAEDAVAGVEAYLRKYCVDDDIDRVIRETSLPYVQAQLAHKPSFTTAYSLRQNGKIIQKRVFYAYIGQEKSAILCAMQNLTETYRQGVRQRVRLASALQTIQEISGLSIGRYDLKTKTLYSNCKMTFDLGYGDVIPDVPDTFIRDGRVAPGSVEVFQAFYEALRNGIGGVTTVALEIAGKGFHWVQVNGKLADGDGGAPHQAIMVFQDIEEQREQAVTYQQWRKLMDEKKPENYTLFRCNLSKGASFDRVEGRLLNIAFDPALTTFNQRTREYARRFVHPEDDEGYVSLLNSENLLAGFYRGIHGASLNYRERVAEGEYRWLHLTVEMMPFPGFSDVEVSLLYEPATEADILAASEQLHNAEDPLTGVLNRRAFVDRFHELLQNSTPDARHALLLLDIDGFKRINENFGHEVGDQALADTAQALLSAVQEEDLVGRLGGDEFLICLKNIAHQAHVEKKAMQLLGMVRRAFSEDIRLSASLGIALFPDDGQDFTQLYHHVDMALYRAKVNGRDSFAFYHGDLERQEHAPGDEQAPAGPDPRWERHLLLVDDSPDTRDLLEKLFAHEYRIDVCDNEPTAFTLIRRYGLSLAAVVISLDVPSLDGMMLLERIRRTSTVKELPIIVLGREQEREVCLQAMGRGASDLVLKPILPELLRVRIESAVSKAENERLRTQNAYLQTQSSDAAQFLSVYEHTDTVVVEYDWKTHRFVYDPSISQYILGRYDDRSLWQIFMADMVADVQDVQNMQSLICDLAASRTRVNGTMDILLTTPSRAKQWFTMNVYKRVNDRNLTSKIILTFRNVDEDMAASKKLRFLAEHDSLTGLYNRATFLRLVEESVSLRPSGSYLILYCDINDFRYVNERYGREEGDRLLRYAADKILTYAAAMNGFAGRLSNDTYALLLPNNPGMLNRVRAITRRFFTDYPLKATLAGRAGAYIITDPGMSADAMIDFASTACNTIKGKYGSWLAVYGDSMNEQRLKEKSVTDRMEAALANGQFDIYLQPQFYHATGHIAGAEALVRWLDPERGVIAPGEFIPIFEKNGFITQLDEYVWEKAAAKIGAWVAAGYEPVPLSVNVSRADTNDPELCKKLLRIVEKHQVPLSLFRLEITESLFTEDTDRLMTVVEQLHDAGFLIEMDDFGSGYSSLNILKDVPVDIIKLDMKFFSGKDSLGRGGMIVDAVLRMSRWLNISVIAEGVEQREQADFLLSVGCQTIQGYLYARPMPVSAFEELLRTNRNQPAVPQAAADPGIDAGAFWNPSSADSQVFNHYIGPATVFEYHQGDYEIVRMNRRFLDAVGIDASETLPAKGMVHLCREDEPAFRKAVLEAIATGGDVKVDLRRDKGDGEQTLFHTTLRLITQSYDRSLLFASLEA